MSICPRNVQGVQAPELPAGQRNLRRRLGRQPKAQPFLLPWYMNTGLQVGALGHGAWEAPSTCGYLAGEPTPRESWSWIITKTNCKSREIPCYRKHSSPREMGLCVPSNLQAQRGLSSVCGAGGMWWLCSRQRRHLG